jgi:tetratricopeptide (TPR) repeat protein
MTCEPKCNPFFLNIFLVLKIVHSNKEVPLNRHELFADAKDKEAAGEWKEAIALYEKVIKLHPLEEKAYDRIMIAYRKLKEPRKELNAIKSGIDAFEELYKKSKKTPDKKVIQISRALQKATGLLDKKGESIYRPEPIGRWLKRKAVVEKQLKKKKE